MPHETVFGVNIVSTEVLISPNELKRRIPMTDNALETVINSRNTVRAILENQDPRLFVVVGPCSIHDEKAGVEYALRLRELADKVSESMFIIMRVYFEKPRTTIGWKGYINDPYMDDSFKIQDGLMMARRFLLKCAEIGLPAGTEALDPITPPYLSELVSWSAIGARTTESQTHREMSSGLSMPVGFKNGTDGSIQVALDAMKSALSAHSFLGINQEGQTALIRTRGNRYGHIVLRGGSGRPNYDSVSVRLTEQALAKENLPRNIVIDCSHANSFKDHNLQPLVVDDVANQINYGTKSIVGLMLESNLYEGNQAIPKDLKELRYGVSVTDKCMSWERTERLLLETDAKIKGAIKNRYPVASAV
ncbi:MAG: phospho-2-dehydro-3-deoxyheptonate aldolase [Chloroflexi bacterium]|nr:phospho-2-dehydro-3-deoxyheptonate aldolase [Chloroflexota bacterium]